jgi:hypothetical protein
VTVVLTLIFYFLYAEITNSRVAWCSIGALMVCVGMAVVQIWSLRKFFVRKKIL